MSGNTIQRPTPMFMARGLAQPRLGMKPPRMRGDTYPGLLHRRQTPPITATSTDSNIDTIRTETTSSDVARPAASHHVHND